MPTEVKRKRTGLLGGTFDPVHNGHLAVADHVLHELGLETVCFIPAALPPHKHGHADGQEITGFAHRLAMLKLAAAGNDRYTVSDIEALRSAPSYTIDTLNILIPQIGKQAELYFIIGVDAFLEINTWKQFRNLPELVNFVIITRPVSAPDKVGETILQNFDGYAFDATGETWSSPAFRGTFMLQHMEPVPISSTDIRERIRRGQDLTGLVPPSVEDYIKKQNLYK